MTQTFINIHLRDGRVLQFLPRERVTALDWRDFREKIYAGDLDHYSKILYRRRWYRIHFVIKIEADFSNPFRKPRRRRQALQS
jgi:hypothetical protein